MGAAYCILKNAYIAHCLVQYCNIAISMHTASCILHIAQRGAAQRPVTDSIICRLTPQARNTLLSPGIVIVMIIFFIIMIIFVITNISNEVFHNSGIVMLNIKLRIQL